MRLFFIPILFVLSSKTFASPLPAGPSNDDTYASVNPEQHAPDPSTMAIKPLSRTDQPTNPIDIRTIPNPGYEHHGAPPPTTWNNLPLEAADPKAVIDLWENHRQQPKSTGTFLQGQIYPVSPQINRKTVMIRGIPNWALAKDVMFKIYALNQIEQLVVWVDAKSYNPTKPRYLIVMKYIDCRPASEVSLSSNELKKLRHLARGHILKAYQLDVGEDSKNFCYTRSQSHDQIAINGWLAHYV